MSTIRLVLCCSRYNDRVKRDAQATRQRILDAAAAEFSRYGLAGARVDRIAAASGSNKAMIYTYFGSKEGLLEAVGAHLIAAHIDAVPLDPYDLPEYAARVFEHYHQHPALTRLVHWDWLEQGSESMRSEQAVATVQAKIAAIERAQREGRVSARFPAPLLFEVLIALIELRPNVAEAEPDAPGLALRREAIKAAVALLVDPALPSR